MSLILKELSHSTVLSSSVKNLLQTTTQIHSNQWHNLPSPKATLSVSQYWKTLHLQIQTGMHITSQHRLEVLFKRTPYADTVRYFQNFKNKQVRFQNIFYNLDHKLYSHTCCEWVFYIRDFNNEHIAFFYLLIFPPQATPKLSEIIYTDIVYTINLDATRASCENISKNS